MDLALASEPLVPLVTEFDTNDTIHSDHIPILIKLKINNRYDNSNEYKTIRKFNPTLFAFHAAREAPRLLNMDLNTNENITESINALTCSIKQSIDSATTVVTIPNNPNGALILPKHLVDLIKTKRLMRKKYKKTRIESYNKCYNHLAEVIKKRIQKHKQEKWQKYCSDLNSHQISDSNLWKKLKNIDSSEKQANKAVKLFDPVKNEIVNDPRKICDMFADNLQVTFTPEYNDEFDNEFKEIVEESQYHLFQDNQVPVKLIEPSEVKEIIKDIRGRGAPGPDNISNKCLKILPVSYIYFLTAIFNACLLNSFAPECWKTATVKMIPKPMKDLKNVTNYRPISLLNTLSKILERCIQNRLLEWINKENVISKFQSGFVKKRQTRDHLIRLTQSGLSAFNRDQKMGAIFVDIEKAFDKVWHAGLTYKLNQLKIPNYLGLWIRSYLTNRNFYIKHENLTSTTRPIQTGVPQGSVLGPILFNLFFNDVSAIDTNVNQALFADDISVWSISKHIKVINLRLQSYLDQLEKWMNKWRTKVSSTKTTCCLFQKSGKFNNNSIELTYKGTKIKNERNPKFLGVILDPGLNFREYALDIKNRALRRLNILRSIKGKDWGASSKILMATYKSFIRSLFDYAPFAIITMTESNYLIIERLQRAAARIITYWPIKTNTKIIYERLKLSDVKSRSYKLIDSYLKKSFTSNQIIVDLVSEYNTAFELDEEAHSKTKPRSTIFGLIKRVSSLFSSGLFTRENSK